MKESRKREVTRSLEGHVQGMERKSYLLNVLFEAKNNKLRKVKVGTACKAQNFRWCSAFVFVIVLVLLLSICKGR